MFRPNKAGALGRPALVLAVALALAGCDSTRSKLRKPTTSDSPAESKSENGGTEVLDVKPDSKRPFFSNSRLPGGMSDEGREIERDLGIK